MNRELLKAAMQIGKGLAKEIGKNAPQVGYDLYEKHKKQQEILAKISAAHSATNGINASQHNNPGVSNIGSRGALLSDSYKSQILPNFLYKTNGGSSLIPKRERKDLFPKKGLGI